MYNGNTLRLRIWLSLVVLLLAEAPLGLKAQPLPQLRSGSRVRLRIDQKSSWLVGVYRGRNTDSLRIVLSGETEPKLFDMANVREIEVSRGRFPFVGKTARIGAAVGAGAAVVLVIGSSSGCGRNCFEPGPLEYFIVVSLLASAGAIIGALSGVVVEVVSGESWTPVSITGMAAGGSATSVQVGYRLRF